MTNHPTGSDYVRAALEREGVETLFGLIGEGNAHLLDACGDGFVYARHEQAAVTMADGYARETGRVGVVTLTHGPGVTNGATGLAIADRDGVPLVCLVGDADRTGRETSLQYLDHGAFTAPVSVYQTRAETPADLPETLRRAFRLARIRRGPAVVELPGDVQRGDAPEAGYDPSPAPGGRPRPDPDVLAEAAETLSAADSPVVLAGGGAFAAGAGDALADLAETLGAPVATTLHGKGVLPESHPFVSGVAGTFLTPANDRLLWDADALLAVGARLAGKTTRYGELFADADVVQVDVSPEAFGVHRDPDVAVVGDARDVGSSLAASVEASPDRAERVREAISDAGLVPDVDPDPPAGRIDPRTLTAEVSRRLPEGTTVCVDSGNNTGFPAVYHSVESGRLLVNGNFGCMGYALPAALGAAVADPDRPVVATIGDGAFQMVLQEVETAVRYDLPVLVVVYNDASYGIIRHRQEREYGRSTAAEYDSPSFETVARGLGAEGVTVRDVADLDVVDDFLADPRPTVLDARTDPAVSRPGFPPY